MPYIYWPIGLHLSKAKAIVLVRIISEVRVYILDVIRDRVQIAHLQLGLFPKLSVRKFAKLPSFQNQCTFVVLSKNLDLLKHGNVYLKAKKENFRFGHWFFHFSIFSALWLFWDSQCGKFRIFLSFRFYVKSILENLENLKNLKLSFFAILGVLNFVDLVISALKSAKTHKFQHYVLWNVFTWQILHF